MVKLTKGLQIHILDPELRSKMPFYWNITRFHPKEEFMDHVKNVPHAQLAHIDKQLEYEVAETYSKLGENVLGSNVRLIKIRGTSSEWHPVYRAALRQDINKVTIRYTDGSMYSFYWMPTLGSNTGINYLGNKVIGLFISKDEDLQIWLDRQVVNIHAKDLGNIDKILFEEV